MNISINNEQEVVVTFRPKTAAGTPVQVDNFTAIIFDASPDDTVEVEVLAAEPESFERQIVIRATGIIGTAEVQVNADADLGEGVTTISDMLYVTVTQAQASGFCIEVGDPQSIETVGCYDPDPPVEAGPELLLPFSSDLWDVGGNFVALGEYVHPWQVDSIQGAMCLHTHLAVPISFNLAAPLTAGVTYALAIVVGSISLPSVHHMLSASLEGDGGLLQNLNLSYDVDVGTHVKNFIADHPFTRLNIYVVVPSPELRGECFLTSASLRTPAAA